MQVTVLQVPIDVDRLRSDDVVFDSDYYSYASEGNNYGDYSQQQQPTDIVGLIADNDR